jgi:membrane associated rhomboid family serine protease
MQPPPSLAEFQRYPITTSLAVLAIVATLTSSGGEHINPVFLSTGGDCLREPWRLVTPALFHGGYLHLFMNLGFLWVFGTLVEDRFGHPATLGICCLLAAGTQAAELAVGPGCIGLSGVGFGLFGMLWVLSSRDPRFRDAVDRQTVQFVIGWFFFCIVLTVTDIWKIGNVAHGVGCVLGALLGWTISARAVGRRAQRGAVLAAAFLLCLAGGTIARPYVNVTGDVGWDFARRGYAALMKGDNQQAVELYEGAVKIDAQQEGWWNNLGIAYRRVGRFAEAKHAFDHADALRPREFESGDEKAGDSERKTDDDRASPKTGK